MVYRGGDFVRRLTLFLLLTLVLAACGQAACQEAEGPRVRVLFDHTKGETVGNADWVVDDDEPAPLPAEPRSEHDWTGALSAWGYALHATGRFRVQTLPRWKGRITHREPANPHDLSRYDVFVIPEPNLAFSQAEVDFLEAFVTNGGGLFLLANHCRSDRNKDGYDPPHILNQLTEFTGIYFHEVGDGRANCWFSQETRNVSGEPRDPIVRGEYGEVKMLDLRGATSMMLMRENNTTVQGHIWRKGIPRRERGVVFATSRVGKGRVAAIADSSPSDDGTGHRGKRLFPNWKNPSHKVLFLNATTWLAGGGR